MSAQARTVRTMAEPTAMTGAAMKYLADSLDADMTRGL
jgi:hypothetical protein